MRGRPVSHLHFTTVRLAFASEYELPGYVASHYVVVYAVPMPIVYGPAGVFPGVAWR